jgi:histidinol-phosphate aminotransferase
MEFNLDKILRQNIKNLKPYSSARDEFKGKEGIFLDANENSFGSPLQESYNRYPDPMQLDVKDKLGKIKGLPIQNIFLGNGSDEAIDILFRAFCEPGKDNAIICPPTYGMYEVSAGINNVEIIKVPLFADTFQLDVEHILKAINKNTKLIFFCCPNNPTGNGVKWNDIKTVLENFSGIVVIDEAYINFAKYRSLIPELLNYPNLVILQTLSKAWGLAGLRIGMAFASEPIIDIFNKIKPPYNINAVSQKLALEALNSVDQINNWIKEIVSERDELMNRLPELPFVQKVYPSDANFILVKVNDPQAIYNYLVTRKIIVRDRSKVELCQGCLRITVGTKQENKNLLSILNEYK